MIPEWVSWIDSGNLTALIPTIRTNPHMRTSLRPYTPFQTDIATPLGYAILTDNQAVVRAILRHDNANNVCWHDMDADDDCDELDALGLAVQKHVQWLTLDTLLTYGNPSPDSLRFALYCVVEELANAAQKKDEPDPYLKHVRRELQQALQETLEYLDRFYAVRWCVSNISF